MTLVKNLMYNMILYEYYCSNVYDIYFINNIYFTIIKNMVKIQIN